MSVCWLKTNVETAICLHYPARKSNRSTNMPFFQGLLDNVTCPPLSHHSHVLLPTSIPINPTRPLSFLLRHSLLLRSPDLTWNKPCRLLLPCSVPKISPSALMSVPQRDVKPPSAKIAASSVYVRGSSFFAERDELSRAFSRLVSPALSHLQLAAF